MHKSAASASAYDSIAHLYDVDMARNMPFDDIGFYARICESEGGRVLEEGCGNGRILLELERRGIDALGIDRSARMLDQLKEKAHGGVSERVCRMDVRRLAFASGTFQVVLCPYSLITYMAAAGDADLLLAEAARVLRPGGVAVVDAFVPQMLADGAALVFDYRRPYGEGTLSRSKRIVRTAPSINRIQRRYEICSASGDLVDWLETEEDIHEFSADELCARVTECGLAVEQLAWNYVARRAIPDARFVTVLARKPASGRA